MSKFFYTQKSGADYPQSVIADRVEFGATHVSFWATQPASYPDALVLAIHVDDVRELWPEED